MIQISDLHECDKGRSVTYISSGRDTIEHGVITSWNDKFIFVRYNFVSKPKPIIRTGQTSEAASPEDLWWGDGASYKEADDAKNDG